MNVKSKIYKLLLILLIPLLATINCSKKSSSNNSNPLAPGTPTQTLNVHVIYNGAYTVSSSYPIVIGIYNMAAITNVSPFIVQNATSANQTLTFTGLPTTTIYAGGFIDVLNTGIPNAGEPFIIYNNETNTGDPITITSGGTVNITITLSDSYIIPGNLFLYTLDGVKQPNSYSQESSGYGVISITGSKAPDIVFSSSGNTTGTYTLTSGLTSFTYFDGSNTYTASQATVTIIKFYKDSSGWHTIGVFSATVTNNNAIPASHTIINGVYSLVNAG